MTDTDRQELHRRVMLLREQLDAGSIHFMSHLADNFKASLSKVRVGEDGLVDPTTVDARIRTLCLLVAHFDSRETAKKAMSLRDVQEAFYANIESVFHSLYEQMLRRGATPYGIASAFAASDERVRATDPDVLKLLAADKEFWEQAALPTWIHCEDSPQLKGVFGGSLFPESGSDILSSCGLYLDTIYLPDPLLRISRIAKLWTSRERVREVTRFGLELLHYRDAVLADIDPPLAVILPDLHEADDSYHSLVRSISEPDILKHSSLVFGRAFASTSELKDYASQFKTAAELVKALAEPDRLLFDAESAAPLEAQIEEFLAHEGQTLQLEAAGDVVYAQASGRMLQANDALSRGLRVHGVPIIDAETSWRYFNWKLDYAARQQSARDQEPFHIVRGLQDVARGDMEWLGRIPLDSLIEIRRRGALGEIRSILTQGISDITSAAPADFMKTSERVAANIQEAFRTHRKNIADLRRKKWQFAGHDIGSWVILGTLEISAVVLRSLPLAIAAYAADQILAPPRLKDMPGKVMSLQRESSLVRNSAAGLLFRQRSGSTIGFRTGTG